MTGKRGFLGLIFLISMAGLLMAEDYFDGKTAFSERWYTYWGVGTSVIGYEDENYKELYERMADVADSRTSIALDLFGIYLPVRPQTIVGVIVNVAGDRFQFEDTWFQENYYLYSFSVIHYLSRFGKGFFIRADGGISAYNYQDSDGDNINGKKGGYGVLAGGGYALNLGGSSLMLNINYSYRTVEEIRMNFTGLSLGILF
mgnify:CR=1 FL=1